MKIPIAANEGYFSESQKNLTVPEFSESNTKVWYLIAIGQILYRQNLYQCKRYLDSVKIRLFLIWQWANFLHHATETNLRI